MEGQTERSPHEQLREYLDSVPKSVPGLREQLKDSWKEHYTEPLTEAKLKEYLMGIFKERRGNDKWAYEFGTEVSPGWYYLGPGTLGGIGALEAVSKQMREMSQKTIDSIIKPRKS